MVKITDVIVLRETSESQLTWIRHWLAQEESKARKAWVKAQKACDCTDQIDPDIDNKWNALTNFCHDMNAYE